MAVICGGMIDMKLLQEAVEVARPAGGHGRSAKRVLQRQVPADDPCHQLTQRCISVGVGRTRNGNDRGELRVAQSGKRAGQSCHHKAQCYGRPGAQRRSLAGQRKDAGANDGADAERDQVQRAQRALERVFALLQPPLR